MGFFLSEFKISIGIQTIKRYIQVFEPTKPNFGAEVTYSINKGRKSFCLPRPLKNQISEPPVAVESFALDPDYYFELMKRVENIHKK